MPRAPKAAGHSTRTPWSSSTRRASLPPDWAAQRQTVLEAAIYRCEAMILGVVCGEPANQVDHVERGGEVLQAMCRRCHARKSSGEGNEVRWGRGPV